ncbi:MAG TPA: D-amino-acid transaminase [Virgibacillus sp.]|nr:D-amino-acid transaminase [Virgibacillus sp.]
MPVYNIVMSQDDFIQRDQLTYPFEERGLQFGDGVYEVIRIYDGVFYLLDEHMNRLYRSLKEINIDFKINKNELINKLDELLERNNMQSDGQVYLQITRGSATRTHTFPVETPPNIYAYVLEASRPTTILNTGVPVITQPDQRWKRRDIKSLNLLPNVLAKQAAADAGAHEAILYEDGFVTECSSSNVYLVKNGNIYTHPANHSILNGCVRLAVKRFSEAAQIPFIEEAFSLDAIDTADELFLSSSTNEVMPIIKVDDRQIADGKPGNLTRRLQEAYVRDAKIKDEAKANR